MMLLLINSPARMPVVIELGDVTECLCCCMYSVCRSVSVLSCVYVIQSFMYVLRVVV